MLRALRVRRVLVDVLGEGERHQRSSQLLSLSVEVESFTVYEERL